MNMSNNEYALCNVCGTEILADYLDSQGYCIVCNENNYMKPLIESLHHTDSQGKDFNLQVKEADDKLNKGEPLHALKIYHDILQKKPKNTGVLGRKSVALIKLKQYENAVECCDKIIRIDPNNYIAYANKGIALYHLKKYTQAINCFNKSFDIEPSKDTLHNKELTEERLKDSTESKKITENSLTRDHSFEEPSYFGVYITIIIAVILLVLRYIPLISYDLTLFKGTVSFDQITSVCATPGISLVEACGYVQSINVLFWVICGLLILTAIVILIKNLTKRQ